MKELIVAKKLPNMKIGVVLDKSTPKNIYYSQIVPMVENVIKYQTEIIAHNSLPIKKPRTASYKGYNFLCKILFYSEYEILYVRSELLFMRLFIARYFIRNKYKICFDFRGLDSAESKYKHSNPIKEVVLKNIERFIYRNSDYLLAVSNRLKSHLHLMYGARQVFVQPCMVTKNVEKVFFPITENDKIRFVYVGGVSGWQNINKMLLMFSEISKGTVQCYLTIITNDLSSVISKIKKNKIVNVEVKSIDDRNLLLEELTKHDFGFLIRDDILMNNVSSPIKYVEYISHGVIPILTKGIGDYSMLTIEHNLGIVLDTCEISMDKLFEIRNDPKIYKRLYKVSKTLIWSPMKTPLNTIGKRLINRPTIDV